MTVTPAQLALLGHDGRRATRGWLYVYPRDLARMVDRPHNAYPHILITYDPGSIMWNVRETMRLRYMQQLIDGDI